MEKRVRGGGGGIAGAGEAVGAGPRDFSIGDDRNTHCGDLVDDESPGDRPWFGGCTGKAGGWEEAGLNAGDAGGEGGIGGRVSGEGSERGESETGEQKTHEKLQAEFCGRAWLQKLQVAGGIAGGKTECIQFNHGWTRINTDTSNEPRRAYLRRSPFGMLRFSSDGRSSPLYLCPSVFIRGFLLIVAAKTGPESKADRI